MECNRGVPPPRPQTWGCGSSEHGVLEAAGGTRLAPQALQPALGAEDGRTAPRVASRPGMHVTRRGGAATGWQRRVGVQRPPIHDTMARGRKTPAVPKVPKGHFDLRISDHGRGWGDTPTHRYGPHGAVFSVWSVPFTVQHTLLNSIFDLKVFVRVWDDMGRSRAHRLKAESWRGIGS